MTPDPLISVICAARNASRAIETTLRSTLDQTLRRWEMIVVDDGSSDDTIRIVAAYARQDRRISVIQTPGVGRAGALNLALFCARANLVANIDAADASHPRRLELQSIAMARRHDITILSTGTLPLRGAEEPMWPILDGVATCPQPEDVTGALALRNPVVHSSVMVRRDHILRASGYDEQAASQVDYELWVRMAARGYRIHRLNLPLIAKRLHDPCFETRLVRLYDSARVQREAIRVCHAPRYYIATSWARLLLGLLPTPLRRTLSDGQS